MSISSYVMIAIFRQMANRRELLTALSSKPVPKITGPIRNLRTQNQKISGADRKL